MPFAPGYRLGQYEIVAPLGTGGMGEVYRARHLKLGRDVAIKVLRADVASDHSRLARFEREARSASALNHPNIVTIYDVAEQDGTTYIAMELVEGATLGDLIAAGPVPFAKAIGMAIQLARGLARAHAAGMVHRDIKPANVMVTPEGLVKILDFGLAKSLGPSATDHGGRPITETADGVVVGTPHYMSPEQLRGEPLNHRSDQFSFGVVLYELAGGRPPFDGDTFAAIASAILVDTPVPIRQLRPDVPPALERIIFRCLEKVPGKRFTSTTDVAMALSRLGGARTSVASRMRRRPAVAAAAAIVILAAVVGGWQRVRDSGRRWAETRALTEISRLAEAGDLFDAYRSALRAQQYLPGDPALDRLFNRITLPMRVNTEPAGAEVWVNNYGEREDEWIRLGITPMAMRIPYALMRWRIVKEGFEPFEGAPFGGGSLGVLARGLPLDSLGDRPDDMVRVPGGELALLPAARAPRELPASRLDAYYLDRYEVTNRDYKAFVDAGGYDRSEGWPSPIVLQGKTVSWEEAMRRFRDGTARPGPATWEAGTYPSGEDDMPVSGVSWYEAAAYCASIGKTLPTVHHWFRAIGQDQVSEVLLHSNMGGTRKAAVGEFRGLGAYGTYDLAGNVKEWAWNASDSLRFILGGSWNEPTYVFKHLTAAEPGGREETFGIRCARYQAPLPAALLAPIVPLRQYTPPTPLGDEAFAAIRGLFAYDPSPLQVEMVRVVDTVPEYRRETISIRTAYDGERMDVHLLIPRDAAPPYQSVIWFPGDDVFMLRSSESFSSSYLFDFLPRGRRVLVHPVYKGMLERFEPREQTPTVLRDLMIRWAQDISRTIDYLETRPDFDATRIAYYGFSAGAMYGPVFTAVEPRLRTAIFLAGGLAAMPFRPEVHPATFAPRTTTPTLMISGEDDFMLPYELAQRPMFELLGAAPEKKRHARLPGGHIPRNPRDIMREVLDWLDLQLGPAAALRPATARP